MKGTFLITILLLTIATVSQAQESAPLQTAWQDFKSTLDRKNKVITDLISIVKQGQSHDKRLLEEIQIIHDYSNLRLKQKSLDSHEIKTILDLNSQLDERLSKIMEFSVKDKTVAAMDDFPTLEAQLEGLMNRLYVAAGRYNDIAKKLGREDLYIELHNNNKSAPKVEF